jgi:hypothetical protein
METIQPNFEIGPQINTYRGYKLHPRELLIIFLSLIFLFVIPFLIGFYRTLYGYAQFGPVAAKTWGISYVLLSLIFLFFIVTYILYRFRSIHVSINT